MSTLIDTNPSETPRTALVRYAITFLTANLPRTLHYHTVGHVLEVIAEAKHFAELDGLSTEQQELISIAAAFHDFGYVYSRHDNEAFAAAHAAHMMRCFNYNTTQVECVQQIILSTRAMTTKNDLQCWQPLNFEAGYLIDADLSNFGRKDFFAKLELLAKERQIEDRTTFLYDSHKLLKSHSWFTPAAAKLRNATKQENIAVLAKLL